MHTHNGIVVITAIKKNKVLPFGTTWMDLEGIMLNKMSGRERQIQYGFIYVWNLETK